MQCPSCSSFQLHPTKLQIGLPARRCLNCHGILVDLLSYREWSEGFTPEYAISKHQVVEAEDNPKALTCPVCSRIMLKFRISGDTTNRIDVCTHCDTAWLDSGEWQLLGALSLQDKLTRIFTDPWQARIKKETSDASHQEHFIKLLGESDFEKLSHIKQWIDAHPNKRDLLRFILRDE